MSSERRLLIYGATGYTGRMVVAHALRARLPLLLGARDPEVAKLAAELDVPHVVFALDDATALAAAFANVAVVLNCAGPFQQTAAPLMQAALRARVHYLDIAAELDSYRLAESLDAEARSAGVMLLPGSGGSVAMVGCVASQAAARITAPTHVAVALHVSGSMSRGSAISASTGLTTQCLQRAHGELVSRGPDELRTFDFGRGPVSCFPVTLPDLVTLWRATGIENIETFVHVSGEAFPTGDLADMPAGPTAAQREANRYQAVAEVTGADGTTARSVLDTVNGYTFTPLAAAEAARRVLAGEVRPGFSTPAEVFGAGFAETIADTTIVDR